MHDVERYQKYLPLAPLAHVVMVALADANLNCLEIVEEIGRDSDGYITVKAPDIMAVIRKLIARELAAESPLQPDPNNQDELRRYYTLTMLGMQVASAETQRLARLLHSAVDKKLVSRMQIYVDRASTSGGYRL